VRRLLPLSLAAGAVYDALFGGAVLAAPGVLAGTLRLSLPDDQFYLRFIGVFLLALALVYVLPAFDPDRYRGVAAAAVAIRSLGALYLAAAVLGFGRPPVFLLLAAGDALFALSHAAGLILRPPPRERLLV
jgi:hypothetical protein